jgi:hypothetical protein
LDIPADVWGFHFPEIKIKQEYVCLFHDITLQIDIKDIRLLAHPKEKIYNTSN